jgi:hypothetical protein
MRYLYGIIPKRKREGYEFVDNIRGRSYSEGIIPSFY